MEELTARAVKKVAKACGADLIGIAPIERFRDAPIQHDPKQIMPLAKSVIVIACRTNRGTLRGIEEGTYFSGYSAYGYSGMTHIHMPSIMIGVAGFIEDFGYEAMPIGQLDNWTCLDHEGNIWNDFSRPVAPDKAFPDVHIQLRIAAYLAGLGEIGYSKMLLTPEFGPRQRFGIVITEAELEPDPLYSGPKLCNRCMACVRECPTGAISPTEVTRPKLAEGEAEWGKFDTVACDVGMRGGRIAEPGEKGEYDTLWYDASVKMEHGPYTPFVHKPPRVYYTGEAVCGGKGCMRACMISLEARGVLKNKFHHKFRTQKPWKVDWDSDYTTERAPDDPVVFSRFKNGWSSGK